MKNFRLRIFQIIEPAKSNDKYSKLFDRSILLLIILNMLAVILESFSLLSLKYQDYFDAFELVSIVVFTTEYILRIYTAEYLYKESSGFKDIVKYLFTPMALIDFAAIIPFYLPMIIPIDLRFLRILRLTRILRILKINRYTKSLTLIMNVLRRKKEQLVVTLFVTFLLLLLSSSVMYHLEADNQPDAFPNIIASFWWAIATLTTVGYGDVYPITVMGKILSSIIALLGIGIVAIPTGIISSGFIEELEIETPHIRKMKGLKYSMRKKRGS